MRYVLLSRTVTVSTTDSSRRLTRAIVALSVGCILHLATLPGSSFIEEEHQIWHFLTASICLFVFVAFLRTVAQLEKQTDRKACTSSLYDAQISQSASLLRLRKDHDKSEAWTLAREENNVMVQNKLPNGDEKVSETALPKMPIISKAHHKYICIAFAVVVIHRLLRAWNQTGIKYADESDIGKNIFYVGNALVLKLRKIYAPLMFKSIWNEICLM